MSRHERPTDRTDHTTTDRSALVTDGDAVNAGSTGGVTDGDDADTDRPNTVRTNNDDADTGRPNTVCADGGDANTGRTGGDRTNPVRTDGGDANIGRPDRTNAGSVDDEPLLAVENLQTQFFTEEGTVRAVDGISFTIREGEIVGLVGESGAGKSVASASILRLVESPGEIVGGEVRYRGEPLVAFEETDEGPVPDPATPDETEIRERVRGREIAVIFQDPMESLNPVFTVGSQLREFIELNRDLSATDRTAREIAVDMLREVGIPEPERRYEEYPHQFSGGMRQRVLIAMALSCEPSLIVADEPTTALDVTVERQILDLVDDLQDRYDTAFLWVTHDMGVVAEICDRVNVMYLGEIVERAPVDRLFYDTKHPYTQALLQSIPRPDRDVDRLNPIDGVMPEAINPPSGCRFHTRCPIAREACRRLEPEWVGVEADETAMAAEDPLARGGIDDAVQAATGDPETPPAERHNVACLVYESSGYADSEPLETTDGGAFGDRAVSEVTDDE